MLTEVLMKKGKYQSQQNAHNPTSLLMFLILILVIGIILHLFLFPFPAVQLPDGSNDTEPVNVVKDPDSIAIPGYEAITLKADSLEQTISFKNPAQNVCYFKMTLLLEDGTVLWESGYVEPGKTSDPVLLTRALEKGSYPNSVLRYQCFTLDEAMTPLNGAETKLTLRVK